MDKIALYQSFEDLTDASNCAPRLAALRAELKRRGIDGFLIPRADEHQGEYVPPHAERLSWLTGFTGSAGLACALAGKAAVFVDGRYTLQVRAQTDTKLFETLDLLNDCPQNWIEANLKEGQKLGYDPWLHTQAAVERFKQSVERVGATLVPLDTNPLDAVWEDQPPPPAEKARVHPSKLAGEASEAKRTKLADDLKKRHADAAVITLPDSICWLLNVRGGDVPHTPFMLSFAISNADGTVDLFVDERKVTPEVAKHFGNGVRVHAPDKFVGSLDTLKGKTVIADPGWASSAIFDRLTKAGAKVQRAADPCQLPKACKNKDEIQGAREAHVRDGAALSRFLAWFAREAPNGQLTEIDAVEILEGYRRATGALKDVSFDSISGAGPNGAVVHYRVSRQTNRKIEKGQLFLIDSGGQYEDGTTDVTRTVAVGEPTAEMRDRFTRVLKGHIAVATARFPAGTTGAQIDSFARRPLWDAGLDYGHGTGHGVGSYLSVHEGPQSISTRGTAQALMPGMICSNEPGYYKTGEYGIRIESLVVVNQPEQPDGAVSGDRPMMSFETITFVPIDVDLIEPSLLTKSEREWVNDYHKQVRAKIGPELADDGETREWLERTTRPI